MLVEAGIVRASERWLVQGAMYGLETSPADWSVFRDQRLKAFERKLEGRSLKLQQTTEANVWAAMEQKKETNEPQAPSGYVVIYVDDFLAAGPRGLVDSIIKRIKEEWVCSMPEWVHHEGWTKFRGMEMRWDGDGDLHVAQPSYIAELMKRHNVECARPVPFSKPEIPENPQITPEAVRAAQGLVGELLWVSVRTRPDVSFGVSRMSQHNM